MTIETSKTMQTIADYDVLDKIAEGGMGTVYRCRHRMTNEIVAIKVVPPNMANNQILLKRFEAEFRAANRLNHPNVVRAVDFGVMNGRPFLVMEFVDGESLGQRLERAGRIDEEEATRIICKAAEGLHEAHTQGMIHRDIKPDNILLSRSGEVKIADLGLVKEAEADLNLTRTGRGLGTPHFMSPEQFRNAKNADIRCDIYSLGATLYQTVTGELPFGNCNGPLDAWMKKVQNDLPPPRKLAPKLSERMEHAIQRAMNPDPKVRQSGCVEFIDDLTGQGGATPPPAPATHEIWYLIYHDEEGTMHTVKGSVSGIRRSFQEGLLGDASNIRASRTKTGNFEPLLSLSEFADLVQGAERPLSPPTPQHLPSVRTDSGIEPSQQQQRPDSNPGSNPGSKSDSAKPYIPFETNQSSVVEALKFAVVALIAMLLGMAVVYFLFH